MRLEMRFPTYEEIQAAYEARKSWHRWFAWRPVYVSGFGFVWLEALERKGKYCEDSMGGSWWYQYRLPPALDTTDGGDAGSGYVHD